MNKTLKFSTSQNIRIDEFLRNHLPECDILQNCEVSNSKIRRLIVAGAVSVNGRVVVRPSFELRGKSEVIVNFDSEKFFFEKQPDDIQFEVSDDAVLFESDDLIFINKPAFFPVEQTITGNRDNLHDAVVRYLWKRNADLRNPPYAGIMHRLDRETSGVILFTKNRGVNKKISELFQSHSFTKKYVAVVEQNPLNDFLKKGYKFTVEMFMGRVSSKSSAGKWGRVSEKNGGQYSKTEFTVLESVVIENKKCFLIECNLFTGRTHQIRVHLSSKNCSILGDVLYGGSSAKRIYLHSSLLEADIDGMNFCVSAPVSW